MRWDRGGSPRPVPVECGGAKTLPPDQPNNCRYRVTRAFPGRVGVACDALSHQEGFRRGHCHLQSRAPNHLTAQRVGDTMTPKFRPQCEALDNRILPTITLTNGVINVYGTAGNDVIRVKML